MSDFKQNMTERDEMLDQVIPNPYFPEQMVMIMNKLGWE